MRCTEGSDQSVGVLLCALPAATPCVFGEEPRDGVADTLIAHKRAGPLAGYRKPETHMSAWR